MNIKDKTIEKSLSNVRISDEHYKDFCVILYNIKNLFETSQKILGHKDVKRNNGIKINRYANIAKVNNNEYLLEFVLKDNGEILLYSVDLLNKKKQYRENASSKNSMQHDTVNNSVANKAVNNSYSTPVEYYDINYKQIKEKFENGNYDGIIIENMDKNNDDSVIYLVPNPEQIKSVDNQGTFDKANPNIYYQSEINPKEDINKRTDKSKYLTDNEVEQLEKDKQNFETYISKLINGELSPLAQIRVLEHLPSAYNNIPELKGKKVIINQDIYKKIIDLPNRFNKNHNIDRKRALKLPQFISDPLYILQSTSEGNEHRFIVVTNSKGNKPSEKLSIILNPNNNVAVVSAYDEKIDISKEKKNNRVLYDKKKELSKTLSASKAVTIDNSNNSITNSDTDFKSDVKTLLQSNDDNNISDTNHRASIEFKDDETIISLAKSSDI